MSKSMNMLASAVILAGGLVISSVAQADDIVGTWRLLSLAEQETGSGIIHNPLGDHPLGLITFTGDGHMAFIMAGASRKAAASVQATDAEAAALYRTMAAYSGTYDLDGDKLTNHPEVAWNQAWNGTDLHRIAAISGSTLTLTTAPFISPFFGKEIVSTLVFERLR